MNRLTTKTEQGYYMVYDTQACIKKLGEYEDAEESGRMIMIPCKAGDSIYELIGSVIMEATVIGITAPKILTVYPNGFRGTDIYTHDFGKTVFTSREDVARARREANA